ncbi:hypothetical protein GOP47_0005520 [Adiantum capillus-veneris]|uniref:Uncharacterized protein n=1 Tax=Adiantum capillus-veneris TaxID=13818 RepID=A0A9D4V586_ADICA|nr:hypothetical protein GOP47_0005520 [Adiantum capillus-veneris]
MKIKQVMKDKIRGAEEVQRDLRERLGVLEQQAQKEQALLQHLKQERLHALAQGMKPCTQVLGLLSLSGSTQSSEHGHLHVSTKIPCPNVSSGAPKGVQHGANLAVFSARQTVAFGMLEFAHERLTSHMWAHMCERVRRMQTEEERGEYLRIFRGIEGRSAFGIKPLSDATYAELLGFSLKTMEEKELEVEVTLEAAEGRLVDEACKAGFGGIGNMRMQMLVYLQFHRYFKSATAHQRNVAFDFVNKCMCQPEIISHTQRAARLGKLGALQPASQLIQLACFFLSLSATTDDASGDVIVFG